MRPAENQLGRPAPRPFISYCLLSGRLRGRFIVCSHAREKTRLYIATRGLNSKPTGLDPVPRHEKLPN
jgi:hypothetical protein